MSAPRYITTPIYYLNAAPHLGHAYTTIVADFFTRFWKLAGQPTYFLTGTDEHGQKIAEAAAQHNMRPDCYVDQTSLLFRKMTNDVGAAPDDFIRTTDARHMKGATALWETLHDKGYIYKGTYKGWYAVRDEAYYKESEITDGKAPTGAPVTWVEEPCFFLRLSRMRERLLTFYKEHPDFVQPQERYNEAIRWVEQGLNDLAISRSTFDWGIPVPDGPGHVMYVWVDALSNYINALGYPEPTQNFQTFWPHARHVIGKDILRFHAIYWPALLLAADLPPPERLYVHGWWTVEGQKMSKSLGNVRAPEAIIETYGLDTFRYFVLRQIPFGGDGDFADSAVLTRLNADLANDLGNLFQRVLSFVQKQGGTVPKSEGLPPCEAISSWQASLASKLTAYVENAQPHRYLQHMWEGVGYGNQFMDTLAPWKLAKSDTPEDAQALKNGLAQLLDLLFYVATYLQPVMPSTATKMLQQLGQPAETPGPFAQLEVALTPGQPLPKPTPLFQKKEAEEAVAVNT